MKGALIALEAITALLAWMLARKRSDHKPIALLMSAAIFGDVTQWVLDAMVITPLRKDLGLATVWPGWAGVAGHAVDAVWLMWPASVVGASLVVFARRQAWGALFGWVTSIALLFAMRPYAGDGSQGRFLSAVQVTADLISLGLAVRWLKQKKDPATPAQAVLAVIVANEMVSLLAAWWVGPFDRWGIMQASALIILCVISMLQGRFLWATKLSLSPSP